MITLFESLNPLLFDISWDSALYMISSGTQSCLTLCNPMDCSTPGFPVHHQLPELAQTHVHWVGDAIQPSHLLSSPSPPAFSLSQHQGLFKWISSSHPVAKVLELQHEYSGLTSFRIDWFDLLAVQGLSTAELMTLNCGVGKDQQYILWVLWTAVYMTVEGFLWFIVKHHFF